VLLLEETTIVARKRVAYGRYRLEHCARLSRAGVVLTIPGMSDEITIRDGRLDDLDDIVRFNISMAAETEDVALEPDTVRAGVRAPLDDDTKGRYYIAEIDGQAVGQLMVTFEWSDWRNGTFLWIQSVWVEPECRRRGIFKRLYEHVCDQAARPGYCGVRLYVHDHNASAAETYARLGLVARGYTVLETPDELKGDR